MDVHLLSWSSIQRKVTNGDGAERTEMDSNKIQGVAYQNIIIPRGRRLWTGDCWVDGWMDEWLWNSATSWGVI